MINKHKAVSLIIKAQKDERATVQKFNRTNERICCLSSVLDFFVTFLSRKKVSNNI